jgi:hypothetical protein
MPSRCARATRAELQTPLRKRSSTRPSTASCTWAGSLMRPTATGADGRPGETERPVRESLHGRDQAVPVPDRVPGAHADDRARVAGERRRAPSAATQRSPVPIRVRPGPCLPVPRGERRAFARCRHGPPTTPSSSRTRAAIKSGTAHETSPNTSAATASRRNATAGPIE